MIAKAVLYFGQPVAVACDARCDKAWGATQRPNKQVGADEDDVMFFGDSELGIAPVDPGTYEGSHAKPRTPEERLNKWCVRECERCVMGNIGELIELKNWSQNSYNQPGKHL